MDFGGVLKGVCFGGVLQFMRFGCIVKGSCLILFTLNIGGMNNQLCISNSSLGRKLAKTRKFQGADRNSGKKVHVRILPTLAAGLLVADGERLTIANKGQV